MATAKPATKTAAKTSAKPAAKAAPASKPATNKKAAAAAAEEVAAADALILDVGSVIKFLGYGADVEEADMVLAIDGEYEIVGFSEADADFPDGLAIVQFDNPDFNAKKKEHPDTNPKFLQVEVLPDEMEVISSPADDEVEEAEEVAEVEEVAEPVTKGKKAAAEKPAAKTAAKTTPAKAAPAAKGKKADVAESDDSVATLEHEDPVVQELIDSGDDLVAVAQGLEATSGLADYQLGGILSYLQRNKDYLKLEGGQAYEAKGGFALFINDYFNVDYRKAMYLIEIYNAFSQVTLADGTPVADRIAAIGWTKAAKLAKHIDITGSNAEELLSLADANTVTDLSSALTEQAEVGSTRTAGETVQRTTLRFRLYEDQGAAVLKTLEEIKEENGFTDIADALYAMTQDWLTARGGEAAAEAAPKQTAGKGKTSAAAPRRSAVAAKA